MCFMPVTDPVMARNGAHLGLTSSTQYREHEIERLLALGRAGSVSTLSGQMSACSPWAAFHSEGLCRSGGASCLPALAEEFTEFADRLLLI